MDLKNVGGLKNVWEVCQQILCMDLKKKKIFFGEGGWLCPNISQVYLKNVGGGVCQQIYGLKKIVEGGGLCLNIS